MKTAKKFDLMSLISWKNQFRSHEIWPPDPEPISGLDLRIHSRIGIPYHTTQQFHSFNYDYNCFVYFFIIRRKEKMKWNKTNLCTPISTCSPSGSFQHKVDLVIDCHLKSLKIVLFIFHIILTVNVFSSKIFHFKMYVLLCATNYATRTKQCFFLKKTLKKSLCITCANFLK